MFIMGSKLLDNLEDTGEWDLSKLNIIEHSRYVYNCERCLNREVHSEIDYEKNCGKCGGVYTIDKMGI